MRPMTLPAIFLSSTVILLFWGHSPTLSARPLPVADLCSDLPAGHPSGRTHYFCDCGDGADAGCVPGNDAARGSVDAPRQSYEAARRSFERLPAGDTIAFCRGGAFQPGPENRWVNDRCRAEKRCVVRDYSAPWASGDLPAPIIHVGAGGRAFSLEDKGRSSHEEGYTFMHLDLRGSESDRGFFIYNDIDDVDICDMRIDGFKLGVHVAASNEKHDADSDGKNDRIRLVHSRISNSPGQGWLGSCDGCAIEHSYFENNGFAKPKFNHHIYLSGSNKAVARGMRVVGNELYRSAIVEGRCSGVSLVVHGQKEGLLIEGNLIREDLGAVARGCWGIAVDTGYRDHESFRNVVIRNNRIINVGSLSIGVNACVDCLIENNVIVQEQAVSGRHIAAPNRERREYDLPMSAVTIRNNSIYIGPDSGGVGIKLGEEGSGHRLVSNAIFYAGKNRWTCLEASLPASAYAAVGHNICATPAIPNADWEMQGGRLQDWHAKTGLGMASQAIDPGFRSSSAPHDLSAANADSAIVGGGDPVHSSPYAIDGAKRDGAPDAGAFER